MLLLGSNGGGHVILGVHRPSDCEELKREIEGNGGKVDIFELDLASLDSVRSFASNVIQLLITFEKKLDVLIKNAGISLSLLLVFGYLSNIL